jgi:stage V sporulation protein AC
MNGIDQSEKAKTEYAAMVEASSPGSKVGRNCLRAFLVGGGICAVGQVFTNALLAAGLAREDASLVTACILIIIAITFTGLGIYSKIGKAAGAGSIVPITGFANAVAAPAIEHKKEGLVLGVGAKMFVIAGPVIVYGAMASVLVGLIYYFVR